jgi:hypothetical protein
MLLNYDKAFYHLDFILCLVKEFFLFYLDIFLSCINNVHIGSKIEAT